MRTGITGYRRSVVLIFIIMLVFQQQLMAQPGPHIVRIARIQVDPTQLSNYNRALKEQMEAAVRLEPGVLTYYAVADRADPSRITILEIYADSAAYKTHILTPHFLKYKQAVKNMVRSLELTDVDLVGVAKKPGM